MITLVLPYPISANRYWRTYMPKGFKAPVTTLSQEAKQYKKQAGWIAKEAGVREPISDTVELTVTLYPQRPQDWAKRASRNPDSWDDDVRCIDLDNALKVAIDALKGVVYVDDKQVRRIVAERAEPEGEAKLVVTILPICKARVQPSLFQGAA